MESGEKVVRISVRNLVEFILKEGDVDNRITAGTAEKDAMLMGSRLHRKIQKSMGLGYQAEVSLKISVPCQGFTLRVEGRADGIIVDETSDGKLQQVTVDEIKGVLRNLEQIQKPAGVHLAQAKCYAYIYGKEKELEKISIQMTYCHLDTEEIRRFKEEYTLEDLKSWFEELVHRYEKWARLQIEWEQMRDETIRNLKFPFSYREGQFNLAASVYRTIARKKKLFIQAPTGTGKTMAVLYPAVRAMGEGLGEKIFYLTARTITRTVAEQAFFILKEKGLKFRSVTLTAKEKICFCEKAECNPQACPYAKGHFDRVNDAVYDLLKNGGGMGRKEIEEQAEKFQVCPFEFALDLSVWADGIICDYNYVFDPNAHLKRFFADGGNNHYLFLVDEAHNLVERGREMYSASLYKEDVLEVKRIVKGKDKKLTRSLESMNKAFLELKRECENYQILDSVSVLALKAMNLLTEMERYLEEQREQGRQDGTEEEILPLFFGLRSFLNIHDLLDKNYVIYSEMQSDGRFMVKLFCVNPAENLQKCLEQGNSTIFFSATLLPIQYYKSLLSVVQDDYAVYAESTFPETNRSVLLAEGISTKYTSRGEGMYSRIAEYIGKTIDSKTGNYMAFFPSYRLMEAVYEKFLELGKKSEVLLQSQYMDEEEREEFLKKFEKEQGGTLVAFCVMGGIFSEGIDLTQDRLIGAMIVGTGIPQVCNEREILKQYFGAEGFDYAYLYPGMNKVLQSAGRVIRTEKDKGVILLMDERFQSPHYRRMFPREWSDCRRCTMENVTELLTEFWKKDPT